MFQQIHRTTIIASLFLIGGIASVFGNTSDVSAATTPKYIASKYKNQVAPNVISSLNIRSSASANSSKVGTIKNGAIGTVKSNNGTWTKIKSGNVTGYVKNSYCIYGKEVYQYARNHNFPRKVTIKVRNLRVRKKKSTKSKILTSVSYGSKYKVLSESKKWYKIKANGKKGYVSKDYVQLGFYYTTATKLANAESSTSNSTSYSNSNGSTNRQAIVNYALQFVGNPYVYGGNSLTNGIDCSGFTQQVLGHFGYSLPRTAAEQSKIGTTIATSNLKQGDLLFYTSNGKVSHVTMYIGNSKVVHASSPSTGIKISSLWYRDIYKAVRIINS